MTARIYKPAKTAMQSGRNKTDNWILEFFQSSATTRDRLMGWRSGKDTQKQVKLKFKSKEYIIDVSGALEDSTGKKSLKKIDQFLIEVNKV